MEEQYLNRRRAFKDWLIGLNNPTADTLLNSLNQMHTDEWEQKHRRELRKLKGYADLEKNVVPLRDRVRGEFDNYVDNPAWYIKGKAKKLGVNEEDLKKALSQLEEERVWNEDRARRAREVDERFVWNFAPNSSKQRYIDDPNATLFGKEGKFNPLSKEGARDIRDVALGGIGLAGDFVPGFGAFVGPAARTVRNAALIAEDSPYAPSVTDAGKEAANDWLTYGAAAWLQNFRRAKRMGAQATKDIPGLEKINKNIRTTGEIDNTIYGLSDAFNAKTYDEMLKAIDNLPENEIKTSLMQKVNSFKGIGDPAEEAKFAANLRNDLVDKQVSLLTTMTREPGGYKLVNPNKTKEVFANAGIEAKEAETMYKKALDETESLRRQVRNTPQVGKFGRFMRDVALPVERKVEQGVAKNASSLYRAAPADKDRSQIDWYKQNYARDWSMGFVPKGKDTDPVVRAYKEWLVEQQSPTIGNVFGE